MYRAKGGDCMDEKMKKWKQANQMVYGVYFQQKSPVVKALERAADYESIKPTLYIKQALVEKLEKDGWLTEHVELQVDRHRPKLP